MKKNEVQGPEEPYIQSYEDVRNKEVSHVVYNYPEVLKG